MKDYVKKLPSGRFVAKRGYVYFLYDSEEDIRLDDAMVAGNLERMNRGEQVFNRCYDGLWLFQTRRFAELKEADRYLSELITEEVA